MYHFYLNLFIIVLSIIAIGSSSNVENPISIQIFDNIAEISQPISLFDLPKFYSQEEWANIRSDSFRLVSPYVQVFGQVIKFNRPSLNGEKVLIRRDPNNYTYTEAIVIDESKSVIQDLVDNTYYTIGIERIRYLSPLLPRNYSVDFIVGATRNEEIYLRYLQTSIKWRVRYDLNLENDDDNNGSFLQAFADIRSDYSSPLLISHAKLIAGDVNIRLYSSTPAYNVNEYADDAFYDGFAAGGNQQMRPAAAASPTISSSEELAGLYVYTINETFTLDSRSNHILPMFRPTIDVKRYGLIEKSFTRANNHGNAKRAYRIRVPDDYLPKGQVFIRESDQLVGETYWSDQSANETNDFQLGGDPDVLYNEYVELISRRQLTENGGYRLVLSTYSIRLGVNNNRNRQMNVEYRLKFSSQEYLTIKENDQNNPVNIDGTTINANISMDENSEHTIKFTIETQ